MLTLQNIQVSYAQHSAIENVSFSAKVGEAIALIGPSGSGKSTVLRLIVGLVRADRGQILLDGVALSSANADEFRRRIGYVIQEGGLFPHMTARENVSLLPRVLRWDPPRIRKRIEELASLTHLSAHDLDRFPSQLSGGQRQRVSLMRALVLDPPILLLDEPLGALDSMIRRELQQDLRKIFRSLGKTVLLVTHDLAEAAYLSDRIILLRDGRIVQQGALRDLVENPADDFVTRFVNAQRSPLEGLRSDGDAA